MTNEEKNLLRRAVRRYLAERSPCAFEASAMARHLKTRQYVDFDFTVADVEQALALLAGLSPAQTKKQADPLGAITYWSATSDGILAHEREG